MFQPPLAPTAVTTAAYIYKTLTYFAFGDVHCNVQLADEIMLISIISLIVIFAHAPVLSNLIYTKHAQ